MAISLSCKRCRKFIKEVDPKDIAKLTGDEICEECKEATKKGFRDIEAAAGSAVSRINKLRDQFLVELEKMGRKAVKGGE